MRILKRSMRLAALAAVTVTISCAPGTSSEGGSHVARSTLVVGIDVSGSFKSRGRYESSIDFTANSRAM